MSFKDNATFKHFASNEFTDASKMNVAFLKRLDSFRDYLNCGIFVSSSNGGTHIEGSQHYKGLAVDILCPDFKGSLLSLYMIAERFGFHGIGVYPDWYINDKVIGGLHLDERVIDFQGARWIGKKEFRSPEKEAQTIYYALNPKNMVRFGIITSYKK